MHCKRIEYNINVMQQFACLIINPVIANTFAPLFNCTPVGIASDSMMGPYLFDLFKLVRTGVSIVCCLVIWGSTDAFLLLRYFSGVDFHPRERQGCHNAFLSSPHL